MLQGVKHQNQADCGYDHHHYYRDHDAHYGDDFSSL